jgi:iron(III) transport system permease protein
MAVATFGAGTVRRNWRRPTPMAIFVFAALTFLLGLFIYPLLIAILRAIADLPAAMAEFRAAIGAGTLQRVFMNTLIVVVLGATIATIAGSILAWISERTDGNIGVLGELLPLAPLLVPPIAGVIGWAVLLDPRAGLVNAALRTILGAIGLPLASGPVNIYSMGGLVAMTGLYLVPYVYLVMAAALRRLDPALEEASRVNGAGAFRTLLRVTFPAVRPALTASLLIAVIAGIGMFSVPIVLGTAARVDVLAVYLFRLLDTYPPHTAYALALSVVMVLSVQLLLVVQRFISPAGRHAAVGGRGTRSGIKSLRGWKYPARFLVILYLIATSILPVGGLVLVSLQPFWTPNVNFSVLSFANYSFVLFENGPTSRALLTSLALGAVIATAVIVCAAVSVLYYQFRASAGAKIADSIMSLSATIPHTVIGASFLVAFSAAPFRLYGTLTILLLAYFLMAMPFAARAATAAASVIGKELAESSRVSGAAEGRTFMRVLLPLAVPGLIAGWIIVFIHTVGEVTASSLLAGTRNPVIGRVITELWIFGNFPQVAALALVVTAVTSILVGIMLMISRRTVDATLG